MDRDWPFKKVSPLKKNLSEVGPTSSKYWAVVVTQLAEWFLLIREAPSSNRVISKILYRKCFTGNCWKDENKEKGGRAGSRNKKRIEFFKNCFLPSEKRFVGQHGRKSVIAKRC